MPSLRLLSLFCCVLLRTCYLFHCFLVAALQCCGKTALCDGHRKIIMMPHAAAQRERTSRDAGHAIAFAMRALTYAGLRQAPTSHHLDFQDCGAYFWPSKAPPVTRKSRAGHEHCKHVVATRKDTIISNATSRSALMSRYQNVARTMNHKDAT